MKELKHSFIKRLRWHDHHEMRALNTVRKEDQYCGRIKIEVELTNIRGFSETPSFNQ